MSTPFIILLISYPFLLLGFYWVFMQMAKRLHMQNMSKLEPSSHQILEENFKRMVHYIRISLTSLFFTSLLFLIIIFW